MLRFQRGTVAIAVFTFSFSAMPTYAQTKQAVPAIVLGCAASPACRWAVVTVGGMLYWQLTQGNEPIMIPVPLGVDPWRIGAEEPEVLGDPEGSVERWNIPVLADSEAEARRRCLQEGRDAGLGNRLVEVRRRFKNGKTYDCYFEFTP